MRPQFDHAAEEKLREEFIAAHIIDSEMVSFRCKLRRSCLAFRQAFPSDSILNRTYTTEWAPCWNAQLNKQASMTRTSRLWALREWWKWLFARRVLEDNVLEVVDCQKLAIDAEPPLVLRCNLQRHAAEHLDTLSVSADVLVGYANHLKRFNVFLNRLPSQPILVAGRLECGEEVLAAWFRYVRERYQPSAVYLASRVLNGFLDALVRKGVLLENTLECLRREYPCNGRLGVSRALVADDRAEALRALVRRPAFQSRFAEQMTGFLALKRAIGCRYKTAPTVLRDFDRFIIAKGEQGPITAALLARWRSSRPELGPAYKRSRGQVIRQFCLYLRRHDPSTYVPDLIFSRFPIPRFKAYIVSAGEMRRLIDSVAVVAPGSIWPLRPHVLRTLLVVLYTTGLRISEACDLQVGDVDLRLRVLTIRETKFYKSRLVPFSNGLLSILRAYLSRRLDRLGTPASADPFFVTKYGHHYDPSTIFDAWKDMRSHAGLDGARGERPRIHDLRHSFATLRLAAWYREGADVVAKLPLLSTYLGHTTVASTQRYLTILPEMQLAASERFRSYGGSMVSAARE